MNVRMLSQGCWVLALLLLTAGAALAHRVNVFAWVEGDTVFVECKYPDGTKVHEGVVRVLDSTGKELLNGKTNTQGEFSFKVPRRDDLTVVLEAGMGHRGDWPLSKQDLAPAGEAPQPGPSAAAQPAPKTEAPPPAAEEPAPGAASPSPVGIDQAVEKALDKKLAPVMRMLAEMHEQKVRLTDVLGGIGYILGLVGVAAYFKSKSRRCHPMCEANAYIDTDGREELILESVDRVEPQEDGGFLLVDIFGQQKTVKARLKCMNLVNHRIVFGA